MPRYVNVDRQTPMLFPPDLREWIPENHLAHFIVDTVEALDTRGFKVNERGTGSEQYPPSMMLSALIYCYVTGRFSSREIEGASYTDVAVRYITGNTHPDHDTLCRFRRENAVLFEEVFVQVLEMAQETNVLKKVGTVSIDGTKVLANASKHAAVSYGRAEEKIKRLQQEVQELLAKAEEADTKPLDDGLTIPDEIARREERIAKLRVAREAIEARRRKQIAEKMKRYEQKKAKREALRTQGKKPRGGKPKKPNEKPRDTEQHNFTDASSHIMKAGSGGHFEQSYNAQAAVEVESRLIVGKRVTNNPNDKKELVPDVKAITPTFTPENILVDHGLYSEQAVRKLERDAEGTATGITVYAAVGKTRHHRTVKDLEKREHTASEPPPASIREAMASRLATTKGKALYRLRHQTVEPVIGIIKEAMGFRRFMLRGLNKVETEWTLVTLAYNLKRLYNLQALAREIS